MIQKSEQEIIEALFAEKCSCIIGNEDDIRVFRERGVKDLYRLLKEEPEFLKDAFIADKVVGKAAAALMVLGGVKNIFAAVISTPALEFLEKAGITIEYTQKVPHIVNRTQTGWCPLELRCYEMKTPEECLQQIEKFIQTIK